MLQITNASLDQIFALALQHHPAGRLADAEMIYRGILEQQPAQADALHLLGVLACQANQFQTAMALIAKAIAINPRFAAYHSNLGEAYRRAGQFEPAAASYRHALALDPHFADAYINLGTCLLAVGQVEPAREVLRRGSANAHRPPISTAIWRMSRFACGNSSRPSTRIAMPCAWTLR